MTASRKPPQHHSGMICTAYTTAIYVTYSSSSETRKKTWRVCTHTHTRAYIPANTPMSIIHVRANIKLYTWRCACVRLNYINSFLVDHAAQLDSVGLVVASRVRQFVCWCRSGMAPSVHTRSRFTERNRSLGRRACYERPPTPNRAHRLDVIDTRLTGVCRLA